ncbi:capsule biosynthesis protein [Pelagibaculum spongiae]|nr:capsular biosynthesis protein [Pelagibaculum spongiae]
MACQLDQAGFDVHKINFNGGDRFHFQNNQNLPNNNYTGTPENWRIFLHNYVKKEQVTSIFVYGDCRFYHRIAKEVALRNNIEFVVFEEGYLRPHFITMEFGGANAYSQLDLSSETIENAVIPEQPKPKSTGSRLRNWGKYATTYYWAARLVKNNFPDYLHHRDASPLREGYNWIRSGIRKLLVEKSDQKLQKNLIDNLKKQFFVVPLQVHNDSQLLFHSDYESMEDFIIQTIKSFHKNSNEKHHLVFKHHPMDRGHKNYRDLISIISRKLDLTGRVHYGFELHLPTLLDNALGCITINSTVGISALLHSCPTICCGRAPYNIKGLTNQLAIDDFWQQPGFVDEIFYQKFHDYLQHHNQLNGNFYKNPEKTAAKCCEFFLERSQCIIKTSNFKLIKAKAA